MISINNENNDIVVNMITAEIIYEQYIEYI